MRHIRFHTLIVISALALAGPALANGNLVAHLNGEGTVPQFDTLAQGQFIAKIRRDNLSYKLIVANITNVVAAHIHCAPADQNGPVGVTLFGGFATVNGILAQGPILAPDVDNLCGWADIDDVIDAMDSGDTYVNVHTLQNLAGEIRGQVR